ncbi:RNA-dependent DNA polymerase, partial [Vibrio cholerae]
MFTLKRTKLNILTTLREQLLTNNVIMPQEFERLEVRGSHAYKVYSIPKRKAGRRTIAHPSSKL